MRCGGAAEWLHVGCLALVDPLLLHHPSPCWALIIAAVVVIVVVAPIAVVARIKLPLSRSWENMKRVLFATAECFSSVCNFSLFCVVVVTLFIARFVACCFW